MRQGRILPLVGPAVVLYLTAEVVGAPGPLDLTAAVVCAIALSLALVPFWGLREWQRTPGTRRMTMFGGAVAATLVRAARPDLASVYLDIGMALGLPLLGLAAFQLALDTPDSPPALRRRSRLLPSIAWGLTLFAAATAVLAVSPALQLFDGPFLVPRRWMYAAPFAGFCGIFAAAILRLARRRLGSGPEALAASGWAHMGLWGAIACGVGLWAALERGVFSGRSLPAQVLWSAGAVFLVSGHVAMLGTRRPVRASARGRRVMAAGLTVLLCVAFVSAEWVALSPDPVTLGVSVALLLTGAGLVFVLVRRVVDRLLAPFGGRLLRSVRRALWETSGATSFEALGAAILPPLREGSGSPDAEPLLFSFDPPREVRLDAAGIAHIGAREASPAIRAWLSEHPGATLIAEPLRDLVVRRPELRSVVEALDGLNALCVVPLLADGELEGCFVVPGGRRRSALTLEEIDLLERLSRHIAAAVTLLSARERGRQRTREAVITRERIRDELEASKEVLARAVADAQSLKAGGTPDRYREPPIAYSEAMRRVITRIEQLGALDAPVLLVAEAGTEADRIAHLLHAGGRGASGPFLVADCASVRPERGEAALFGEGEGGRPGWLRLAEAGTCVLMDVPALSESTQARLAEALATRRATLADGKGSYPVGARVVGTSRVSVDTLAKMGAFDPELARRFEPLTLEIPPLRERQEDLPSLTLLALDRACRVLGRAVVGMEPAAQRVLADHDWPGNLLELATVVQRAVSSCEGTVVRESDLPSLVAEPGDDPLEGTYAEVEAKLLLGALERANGNKSEAARLLGLKRTTFLDRLKRSGLQVPKTMPPPPKASVG